jgi:hypothetical protein
MFADRTGGRWAGAGDRERDCLSVDSEAFEPQAGSFGEQCHGQILGRGHAHFVAYAQFSLCTESDGEPPDRIKSMAVLKGLRGDPDRKRVLMLFLSESDLLDKPDLLDKDNRGFLRLADLGEADLGDLDEILSGKNLSDTHLERANLSKSDLSNTNLTRAYLTGADLHETNLGGADLREAKGLTQEQIDVAYGDEVSKLPAHLQHPAHWRWSGQQRAAQRGLG